MTVINVTTNGILYVQIPDGNEGYILLDELLRYYADLLFTPLNDYQQLNTEKLYLARDQEEDILYRVKPLSSRPIESKVS